MTTATKAPMRKKAEKQHKPEPLVVNVARESDGYTFALAWDTAKRVHELKPQAKLPDRSFISFDVKQDFKKIYGPVIDHVIPLLTGLSREQIKAMGVSFYDSWQQKSLGQWRPDPA